MQFFEGFMSKSILGNDVWHGKSIDVLCVRYELFVHLGLNLHLSGVVER